MDDGYISDKSPTCLLHCMTQQQYKYERLEKNEALIDLQLVSIKFCSKLRGHR
jgi:hypothetical protein